MRCAFCMPYFNEDFAITNPDWLNMQLRVYLRTYALDQMVQAVSSSAGLRTIKRVEQTLQDLGVCFLLLNLLSDVWQFESFFSISSLP